MKARKQSFLERLTGARTIENDASFEKERAKENILSEKPWSPRIDATTEESGANAFTENSSEEADEIYDESGVESEEPEEEGDEASLAIDMYESDNELVIQSMIAGVIPENLHITITRDVVTIAGRRIPPHGIPDEHYGARELYWGKFSREITLPFEIDTEGAEAIEKYGLLIIRLPKLNTRRKQELKVRSVE